ncbi:Sphingolipid C4-hydroxylase sur2 [Lecanora helva]
MANPATTTTLDELPPLPEYHLTPLPSLLPPIPDKLLTLLLPIAAYWSLSLFFHWIDAKDYFPQYRLHTPAEVLKRNRVSRWEVVRDVVIQQIIQTAVGWVLGMTEPDDFYGKEAYDVAVWARRIRIVQRAIPWSLALLGLDASQLANNLSRYPALARALQGGQYLAAEGANRLWSTKFAAWELTFAWTIYWVLVPAIQFGAAIVVVDTWQYFLHRAMHMNKWMYTKFHSRHHRLYVPYAYGALYNHWFEGFLLDTLGASIAYKAAGMSTRQGMCFFTGSTFKTVDDHCGYALPWDPLQHITSNNAGYHDVHHQSWGIKTNFSQPFFTFWDRLLGTVWTGGDVSARYERSRLAAQKAFESVGETTNITQSNAASSAIQDLRPYQDDLRDAKDLSSISLTNRLPQPPLGKAEFQAAGSRQQVLDDKKDGGPGVLFDESHEEKQAIASLNRSSRRRTTSTLSAKDSLKGLRGRVTGSGHGRTGGILGMDGSR